MATYEERDGQVRAKVRLRGVHETKTFPNKTKAREWATSRESAIVNGALGMVTDMPFSAVIDGYAERLSSATDINRLKAFTRTAALAKVNLRDLNPSHVAEWRDWRLKKVANGTVLREWSLLSAACKWAIKERRYMQSNPFPGVDRPPEPPHRDRRPMDSEIERLCYVTGYTETSLPSQGARVVAGFLLAVETGMRLGELHLLYPKHVHLDKSYVQVEGKTLKREAGGGKTDAARRQVPLTVEAERLVRQLLDTPAKNGRLLGWTNKDVVDSLWREHILVKAAITDLHFHDSRHEACTRLAPKLPLLDLARMMGIKDLSTLQVYYNPTATEIAGRLRA